MFKVLQGEVAEDHRGAIRYVNDFDMTQVKRFYIIKNKDIETIRGWRAHKTEQRWFYVLSGSFVLDILEIDDFLNPSRNLAVEKHILNSKDLKVILVERGYATAFQALEPNSELLVFADFDIAHASEDDYTYPLEYFINKI